MSYCEMPKVFSTSEPVARKRHKCCECSAPIAKGEKHFYGWGRWDSFADSYRQHLACMEACMLIRDEFNDGDCIGFGDLMEEFANMDARHLKQSENGRRLRHLMAVIKWRERRATP